MRIGKLIIEFHKPVTFKIEGKYMGEIKKALKGGYKLQAIKIYKDATGKGLKESKDFVDSLCEKYYIAENNPYHNQQ